MNEHTPEKTNHFIYPPLTMAQAQQLLNAAQGSDLEALLLLALATGMRRGELLGLKWADIDFERAALQVQRSLDFRGLKEYVEAAPKSERARRQLDLSPVVIEALRQHQGQQQEQRSLAGAAWQEHGYVFTGKEGNPMSLVTLLGQFVRVRTAAGLPALRFHDLRASARHLSF